MSIYSGFATRFQEEAYDHCLDSMLYVLQKRIIRFYSGQPTDEERFLSAVSKLHQQMRKMQKNKYLEPKSSQALSELIRFIQLNGEKIVRMEGEQVVKADSKKQENQIQEVKETVPKKNMFWVEKVVKDSVEEQAEKDRLAKEQQQKEKEKQRQQQKEKEKQKIQFRRTSHHNYPSSNAIHGIRIKNSSRNNNHSMSKSRASSHYIDSKDPLPLPSESETAAHYKFSNTSNNPSQVKAVATRGQAQQIVRDYIQKMKRQRRRSRNDRSDYMLKPMDF